MALLRFGRNGILPSLGILTFGLLFIVACRTESDGRPSNGPPQNSSMDAPITRGATTPTPSQEQRASTGKVQTHPSVPPTGPPDAGSATHVEAAADDFDLEVYIKNLNPPTVEEIIQSLEPIPTLEEVLELVRDSSKRPAIPTLPQEVGEEIAELEKRVKELGERGLTAPSKPDQDAALAEAMTLAERVLKLREEYQGRDQWSDRRGAVSEWFEIGNAREVMVTTRSYESFSPEQRAAAARLKTIDMQQDEAYTRGDLGATEAHSREALAIRLRLLPSGHSVVSDNLKDLAGILRARGDLAASELLLRAVFSIRQREFTDNQLVVASALNGLAMIMHDRSDLIAAQSLYCEALWIARSLTPGDHPSVVSGLNNFADFLREFGELAVAEALQREAVAMRQRLLPNDHPDSLAIFLGNLGLILQARGDLEAAERSSRDALEIYRHTYPNDHPNLATGLNNLAFILWIRGDLAGAESTFREALAMTQRLHPGHPSTGAVLNNLAMVLQARGDLAAAESLYREAMLLFQHQFSGDHQSVATSLSNLASISRARGDLAGAEPLYRESLAMLMRLHPNDNPEVAIVKHNLASILQARGERLEAESLVRESLGIYQRLFPGDHARKAMSIDNLAFILQDSLDIDAAESLFREALTMRRRLFPGDNPSVATSLHNVAQLLQANGDLTDAEPLYREWLEMAEQLRTQIVGAERERAAFAETLNLKECATSYAALLVQLGRENEAFGIIERGRARAVLDLMERRRRDIVIEAKGAGGERAVKLRDASDAEDKARIESISTEALLNGRSRERGTINECNNMDKAVKAQRLAEYDREIGEIKERVERQRRAASQAGAAVLTELRGLFPAAEPLKTDELLAVLEKGELLISLGWSGDVLLVATAGHTTGPGITTGHITVDGKEQIEVLNASAATVRHALETSKPNLIPISDEIRTAARAILAFLMPEEIRGSVKDATRLVVIPDGPMHGIPLEALIALAEGDSVAYVLKDKSIVYAPSATMYVRARESGRDLPRIENTSPPTALIVADPVFQRAGQPLDKNPLTGRRRGEPEPPANGALIAAAVPGGQMAELGLQRGDVLIDYDGREITAETPLPVVIASMNDAIAKGTLADGPVAIRYWRGGEIHEIQAKPGRLGVQIQPGDPAEGMRSWAFLDQVTRSGGLESLSTAASALDRYRLFGEKLDPLPGTRREAQNIERILVAAGIDVEPILAEDATQPNLGSRVNELKPRFLQVATHGLTGSRDRPFDASLALTQPEEPSLEDIGFLTLDELMSKWLGRLSNCELVVLSACDTGTGVQRGDSLMALPIGFFAAGTPTVVASLWKVDDRATTLLMSKFYANLLGFKYSGEDLSRVGPVPSDGGRMSKAKALMEAKRWLRELAGGEVVRIRAEWCGNSHQAARGSEPGSEPEGLPSASLVPGNSDETPRSVSPHPATAADGCGNWPVDFSHPYYWAAFVLMGDPGE